MSIINRLNNYAQVFKGAIFLLCLTFSIQRRSIAADKVDFSLVADIGNYTCDELTRWLGSEKHYSNDKKESIFSLLAGKDCWSNNAPVIFLGDMTFGYSNSIQKKTFMQSVGHQTAKVDYVVEDQFAVAFLSNFSINNNFSHFLHSLLRLFCALLDAKWLVWDSATSRFIPKVKYSIWLDEYFKLSPSKMVWLNALGGTVKPLGTLLTMESRASTKTLLYGSGCVKLLPPEKWFGYPHCRAGEILPAFGHHMRQVFGADGAQKLKINDYRSIIPSGLPSDAPDRRMRVAFAVREAGNLTGKRAISNLSKVQAMLEHNQNIRTIIENVTFEHLNVSSTVKYMAAVHIFVSVHGAGMTNMFFMNPGSVVIEIIPYPLCNCQSPDYFYGVGGYYHGNAIAQNIRHYPYCVPAEDTIWHVIPKNLQDGMKCSWKHLHAVESVRLDASRFVSLMRNVERDMVAAGTLTLTAPSIVINPHSNG